ncbi:MAG: response regulator [Saprospiraceae bacterium]|nr:response regulator [Saprospiraceae bacterium]
MYNSILVIDDNPVDILLHRKVIESTGKVKYVCSASSSKSGIEFIKNLQQLKEEDLIPSYVLLDLDMPLSNGFQFLKDLDQLELPDSFKGVYVVSAGALHAPNEEFENYKSYKGFFKKPLTKDHLESI